ncbi:hypothetical protein NEF87_000473 [Candidatus Lokiarchaeum ossiferum]|uniref:Polyvalent protein metallopeptidase domain-containing protein n=1 Tax=Candidatus Lokiarchaeum ossiferum TaxID=2951803 RepID=A0ABY6HKZ4_9ARCH|nr:hypothetical protein NEF87_000473 [Candidatus Lokiarchaeum sp. B-35]
MTIIKNRNSLTKFLRTNSKKIFETLKSSDYIIFEDDENTVQIQPNKEISLYHSNYYTPSIPYSIFNQGICELSMQEKRFKTRQWITRDAVQKVGYCINSYEQPTFIAGSIRNYHYYKQMEKFNKLPKEEQHPWKEPIEYDIKLFEVWNIDQVNPLLRPKFRIVKKATDIITQMQNIPKIINISQGIPRYRYDYEKNIDEILIKHINSYEGMTYQYYRDFFHELIHSLTHKDRRGRDWGKAKYEKKIIEANYDESKKQEILERNGILVKAKEEFCAEFGSALLSLYCGIRSTGIRKSNIEYLKNFEERLKKKPDLLLIVCNEANASVKHILNKSSTKFTQDANIDILDEKIVNLY